MAGTGDCHRRNRNGLFKALIELAPKSKKSLTNIDIMRPVMRELAPDTCVAILQLPGEKRHRKARLLTPVWQFFSCQEKSGTGKPGFKIHMTKLHRIVCLAFTKVVSCDHVTANAVMTEYLKHCAYRQLSKNYLETYKGTFKMLSKPKPPAASTSTTTRNSVAHAHDILESVEEHTSDLDDDGNLDSDNASSSSDCDYQYHYFQHCDICEHE